jgi:hypothetical protein
MAGEFRPIIIALVLAGLFAVAMISGATQLANLNGATQNLNSNPKIANLSENIKNYYSTLPSTLNDTEKAMEGSPLTLTFTIVVDAIGGIWKTIKLIPTISYTFLTGFIFDELLGSPFAIVTGVVASLLTITLIFAVWKWLQQAEGG